MAAKNETPRQKMIGMMYLVLTALLALQVSSALIYKFQALNTSIEKSIQTSEKVIKEKQVNLKTLVTKRGNKESELAYLEQAKKLRATTSELVTYIELLKKELIEKTGGYDEEGNFKGAKEETTVEVLMIGANKSSGKAYQLKQRLDGYVAEMNKLALSPFPSLAPHAMEEPSLANNSEQKNKDYAHLNFGQTPLVAALAVLSETTSKVMSMEASVFEQLADNVGKFDYTFDKLKPVVKPKSEYVVAGTNYEAELLLVATSSTLKPEMQLNNSAIKVNEDGIGKVSFMASGGNYSANGTVKKTWNGKITMPKPTGGDTTFIVSHEYTVVKPTIQIQSGVVNSLYRNCGNKLTVLVPALGVEYSPTFSVQGATMITSGQAGQLIIVPKGSSKVTLGVSNKGTTIGQETFGVKLIPLPTVDVKINNKAVSAIDGIDYRAARTASVKIIPDKSFLEALPADARYVVTEGKIYLARGRKGVNSVLIQSQQVSLTSLAQDMRPGDRLVVEVTKVERINFNNEREQVSIPAYYQTFMLN